MVAECCAIALHVFVRLVMLDGLVELSRSKVAEPFVLLLEERMPPVFSGSSSHGEFC